MCPLNIKCFHSLYVLSFFLSESRLKTKSHLFRCCDCTGKEEMGKNGTPIWKMYIHTFASKQEIHLYLSIALFGINALSQAIAHLITGGETEQQAIRRAWHRDPLLP